VFLKPYYSLFLALRAMKQPPPPSPGGLVGSRELSLGTHACDFPSATSDYLSLQKPPPECILPYGTDSHSWEGSAILSGALIPIPAVTTAHEPAYFRTDIVDRRPVVHTK
jgi:hypothetical protein